jgi:hypothetical protein
MKPYSQEQFKKEFKLEITINVKGRPPEAGQVIIKVGRAGGPLLVIRSIANDHAECVELYTFKLINIPLLEVTMEYLPLGDIGPA